VSDEAIALAFGTGLPYVGLRDHEPNPELDDLVPPNAARSARVLPLTAADDRIRLAVADPEADLAPLTPYLEGKRVELAIAPREELEEILGPPPLEPQVFEPPAEPAEAPTDGIEEEALAEPAAAPADSIEEEALVAETEPLVAEPAEPAPAEPDAAAPAEVEPAEAEPAEAEPLEAEPAEPAPAPADDIGDEALVAEPAQVSEPDSAAPAEAEPAAAEPAAPTEGVSLVAEPAAPAEDEPPAAEPVEPVAAPAPVVEHYAFAPDEPAGEAPSWLAPPPKRRWLRAIGRFLLYVLVLALVCGAVAAYLLTR
jgi:nicotinate-nucleotide--dimethylbenzimidazole phosphoribosyltransferase